MTRTAPSPAASSRAPSPSARGLTAIARFAADDGWALHLEVFSPPVGVEPLGAVLAIPAMMVDRRSLERPRGRGLASHLAARGFAVHTLDLRGHGLSAPTAEQGGDWSYDDLVGRDIPAAIREVRRRHPALPLTLLGHSLGGHGAAAALGALGAGPVDALVTLGANVWTRALEPDPWIWARKRAVIAAMAGITRATGYLPTRRLGLGSDDEARRYVLDLARFVRGEWTSADGRHDYLAGLARLTCPVLALTASGDRLACRAPSARAFAARMTSAEVRFVEVGRAAWGGAREPDHMSLGVDPMCRPIWDTIADWLPTARGRVTLRRHHLRGATPP